MSGMEYEQVIIGSGLSGLTSGPKLAREGQDVSLLEQHSTPGGCATTFQRLGLEFEVSLHVVDGFRFGTPATFGVPGAGGTSAYTDHRELGFAYVPNRVGIPRWDDLRDNTLRDTVIRCIDSNEAAVGENR